MCMLFNWHQKCCLSRNWSINQDRRLLPTAENLLLQLIPFLKQNKGSKTLTFIQYIYKKTHALIYWHLHSAHAWTRNSILQTPSLPLSVCCCREEVTEEVWGSEELKEERCTACGIQTLRHRCSSLGLRKAFIHKPHSQTHITATGARFFLKLENVFLIIGYLDDFYKLHFLGLTV